MKLAIPLAVTFVILFNILMFGAFYINANPTPIPAHVNQAGEGAAYYYNAGVVYPSASPPAAQAASAGPNGPYAKVVNVVMQAGSVTDQPYSQFSPNAVVVVVGVNNTVTFTNQDPTSVHTVASFVVPAGATSFTSGPLTRGTSYTFTFTVRGTYYYWSQEAPWMRGIVVVK
jgi:plastocyanin